MKIKQVILVREDGEIMIVAKHLVPVIEKLVFDDSHDDMHPEPKKT